MQYKREQYDPLLHDKFLALTVKQPFAAKLISGEKKIEVRSRKCKYRGDILICSSKNPIIEGYDSGCSIGLVELYDIKSIDQFTEEDWEATCIPKETIERIKEHGNGYGWMMRNPRKVIEFPTLGQLGIYNLIYTKNTIVEYPKSIIFEKDDYDFVTKQKQ